MGVKRVRLPYKKPLERPYFTASLVSENGAFSSAVAQIRELIIGSLPTT